MTGNPYVTGLMGIASVAMIFIADSPDERAVFIGLMFAFYIATIINIYG